MSPINFDARLDQLLTSMKEASKYNFISRDEHDLFVNAMASPFKKYCVAYRNGKPIVIDGRVKRRYHQ